jgi:hypothetical protein
MTQDYEYSLYRIRATDYELYKSVIRLIQEEREACARLAETAGLGEPHSIPPYSVRELIAREIRSRGCYDWI